METDMTHTLIVVADEAIARLLEVKHRSLSPVEEITDPDAHAKGAEMRNDAHGRRGCTVTASAGDSGEHQQAERFAAKVAQRLEELRQQGRFDALQVAAAPRFLGYLRQAFNPQLAGVLKEEIDKDLVHESNESLAQRLLVHT